MDEMWKWLKPAFKVDKLLEKFTKDPNDLNDSLFIKKVFVEIARVKETTPVESDIDVDYYDVDRISKVFDLEHEFFINKGMSFSGN